MAITPAPGDLPIITITFPTEGSNAPTTAFPTEDTQEAPQHHNIADRSYLKIPIFPSDLIPDTLPIKIIKGLYISKSVHPPFTSTFSFTLFFPTVCPYLSHSY